MLISYCSDSFLSLLCQIPGIPLLTTQTSGSGEFLKIYNLSQISIIDKKSSTRFALEKITQSKNYSKFPRYFMNQYRWWNKKKQSRVIFFDIEKFLQSDVIFDSESNARNFSFLAPPGGEKKIIFDFFFQNDVTSRRRRFFQLF